jgi:hypothetical protein
MPESIASPTLTKAAVRVAVSGSINLAPVGTTLPTSTTGSLHAAFKPLGYLSEDGLEESIEVSRDPIRGWQNAATVREVVTEAKLTYAGVLIETTVATVEAYYAATVTQTATHGTYTIIPGKSSGPMAGVITIWTAPRSRSSRARAWRCSRRPMRSRMPVASRSATRSRSSATTTRWSTTPRSRRPDSHPGAVLARGRAGVLHLLALKPTLAQPERHAHAQG